MNSESIIGHVTPVGRNIFIDLGFEPEEAATLLAEAEAAISEKQVIKNLLMAELEEWIETKKLNQAEAADILGVKRPRVSDLINRKLDKFTIDALVDMLAKTGKRVQLSVR